MRVRGAKNIPQDIVIRVFESIEQKQREDFF